MKAPTAKAGNVPAAVVLSTEVMPAATAPLPLGVTPLGTIAADGAPLPRMAAAAATPSPSITALQIRIAHFIDGVGAWLSGLPTNPITEFAAGALLLLRRALFPTIPPIEAVTTGQVYGGYVLRTPDNPPAAGLSDDVIEAAQRIRADAAAAEPEVTRDMIDFANAHGGRMEGLDFRLKSEQSLARKIADRVQSNGGDPWAEAQKLSDVTRYTMTFPTAIYAQSVAQTVADLSLLGYQLRIKNYWQQGDPYQGINVALTAPTGQKIELQFHTPESLAVKEGDLHKLYEIFRESQDNDERWRTYLAMTALAMTIPMPSYQVLAITALEFQPFEILQTVSVSLGEDSLITLLAAA